MGVIRVILTIITGASKGILAIIIGLAIIDGLNESFRKTGGDKALTMLFTTLLICLEVWLIGG